MKANCQRTLRHRQLILGGLICLLLVLVAGCARTERRLGDRPGPIRYNPANIYAVSNLEGIVRVAVFPIRMEGHDQNTVETIEEIFFGELRRSGRFDVIMVGSNELRRRGSESRISLNQPFPEELLQHVRSRGDVDAVLLTEITHYRPYRPIAVGVRSRLFSVADLRVVWECDELFDSGSPAVAAAARAHVGQNTRMEYPLESTVSVLQSPSRFSKYVAGTLYETFPPRRRARVLRLHQEPEETEWHVQAEPEETEMDLQAEPEETEWDAQAEAEAYEHWRRRRRGSGL